MKLAFASFVTIVLAIWALMHVYVFWRLSSLPWINEQLSIRWIALVAALLWLSYPLARVLHAKGPGIVAVPLEWIGSIWVGVLFLLLSMLIGVELVTAGGRLFPNATPVLRSAAVLTAVAFSLIALVQGLRPPVVRDHEVRLADLPPELDGLVVVALTDLHLGSLNVKRRTQRLVDQVKSMGPDAIVVIGDVIEGNASQIRDLLPVLRQLRAPRGIWAVTGNHEYYSGIDHSVRVLESAGFTVLRDRTDELAPGLVFAGVDDLTGRQQFGDGTGHVARVLEDRPPGAAILLSHSPMEARQSALAGAGLMLCGHTHAGQIWPFNYVVQLRYPLLAGRYDVEGMPVIVCRGTGTWGPPMRLWRPNEMLRITLRATALNNARGDGKPTSNARTSAPPSRP